MYRLKALLQHLDEDVLHSGLNLMWRIVSGPITLVLLPLFTTPSIQGFWYTFISLAALTLLADLGFTTIATQFVAHEFAFLSLGEDGLIRGEPEHLAATGSFLRFVMKWGIISGMVVVPVIFGIGFLLFAQKAALRVWFLPWGLFSVGTLINYWGMILLSFLQGASQVARVQRISLYSRMAQSLLTFGLLIVHSGLYALAISTLAGGVILAFLLVAAYPRSLRQLLANRTGRRWGREVLSLLWRYAMSWTGGYLNMQVFTPIAFQFRGPVLAGKVGITMTIWSAATNLSIVWLTANVPKINVLVERSQEGQVSRFIRELLRLALLTFIACVAAVALLLFMGSLLDAPLLDRIVGRFMGLRSALFLVGIGVVNVILSAMAIYVRAHKEEPFLLPFVISGAATALLSFFVIRFLDVESVFLGFLISTLVSFPWFYGIYRKKKALWGSAAVGAGHRDGVVSLRDSAPRSLDEASGPEGKTEKENRKDEE